MLSSIVDRNRLLSPLKDVEKHIIRSATKLFLKNGFSKTTLKMISEDCGMLKGRVAYHFHTKEDMLYMLIQELMDYHGDIIDEMQINENDVLFSYATEITIQIALCEVDDKAWDLYYNSYTLPGTYQLIKDWAAKKNYNLLKSVLPDMTEKDFRYKENVASAIELSALTTPCNKEFTLENKITLILDSLMLLYGISDSKRKEIIKKYWNLTTAEWVRICLIDLLKNWIRQKNPKQHITTMITCKR